jgi:hypothetical protein
MSTLTNGGFVGGGVCFLGLRNLLGEERRAEGEETEQKSAAHGA